MKTEMKHTGVSILTPEEMAQVSGATILEEKFADYDLYRAGIVLKEHFFDDDEFFINSRKISKSLAKSLRERSGKVWNQYQASGDYVGYAREWKSILANEYGISWNGELGCHKGIWD